jgi:hypothetical protein
MRYSYWPPVLFLLILVILGVAYALMDRHTCHRTKHRRRHRRKMLRRRSNES